MTQSEHDAKESTEDPTTSGESSVDAESTEAGNGAAAAEPALPDDDEFTEEELSSPEVELQAVRGELEALEDRYLRVRAEYENYKRRTTQEMRSSWNRAQADFVGSLLEALDDLQRVGGWEATSTTVEALIEGVDLVERKFAQALQSAGVEVVEPAELDAFDPNTMEAMLRVDIDDEAQDDSVAQVFARGYRLGDTLIRPARVSVYKSD